LAAEQAGYVGHEILFLFRRLDERLPVTFVDWLVDVFKQFVNDELHKFLEGCG
jgi:hypothetical protein